jgi:hypothetical protein
VSGQQLLYAAVHQMCAVLQWILAIHVRKTDSKKHTQQRLYLRQCLHSQLALMAIATL